MKYGFIILTALVLLTAKVFGAIQVIYTSAVIFNEFKERRKEYLLSLEALRSYQLEPWIIEATNVSHSFFDRESTQVLYPKQHDSKYSDKGINEILSIKACLSKLEFSDDDIVIKITGRYWLYDSLFIDTILQNPGYDVYVKDWKDLDKVVFTGCFAMKWKCFKNYIENIDTEHMHRTGQIVEGVLAEFIKQDSIRTLKIEKIGMIARIHGLGQTWDL